MKKVAKHIGLASSVIVSNVWLLTDDKGRNFLIDTGHISERPTLYLALRKAGIQKPGDLTAVLLTHRHTDHAQNAQWLKDKFGAKIICHKRDAKYLSGEVTPPPIKKGAGNIIEELMCSMEDARPARAEVDEAVDRGPWKYGFSFYPAFGHTQGSVMIYHEPTKTLFTGDALLTGYPPLRFLHKMYLAVYPFSCDMGKCHRYVLNFFQDPPPIDYICSGHGPLVHQDINRKLSDFLHPFGIQAPQE